MKNFIFLLLWCGCNHQFVADCNSSNYFISPNENHESGFKNKQREIITTFSEKDLESFFGDTHFSCKDILTNFFYCNICFNNEANYLISYSGTLFNIDNMKGPSEFTNNVIDIISSMEMGSEEYADFINSQKNSFSKKEKKLLQHYFKTQENDSTINSIRIKTH